jgi:ppGpp synthetase/RelA/SpoT-type nucleotidyltranferase
MPWATLHYTKGQIDRAGHTLSSEDSDPDQMEEALAVLDNWRSAHSFALNTFQIQLRRHVKGTQGPSLVAQRLKRASSIIHKLKREKNMKLSTMQDVAGCRAVVAKHGHVNSLVDSMKRSRTRHILIRETNYIEQPKQSGYRSVHLIYKFNSPRSPEHNGRAVEIQIRSRLQHAWATAVETVGTFLQQSLKSSQGSSEWLSFFRLASAAFALDERTEPVPGVTEDVAKLFNEISGLAKKLDVRSKLFMYANTLKINLDPDKKKSHYFLLTLNPQLNRLMVRTYTKDQLVRATEDYAGQEKIVATTPGAEAVLVAVDSLEALRKAYPNYYLDTQVFFENLGRIVTKHGASL